MEAAIHDAKPSVLAKGIHGATEASRWCTRATVGAREVEHAVVKKDTRANVPLGEHLNVRRGEHDGTGRRKARNPLRHGVVDEAHAHGVKERRVTRDRTAEREVVLHTEDVVLEYRVLEPDFGSVPAHETE